MLQSNYSLNGFSILGQTVECTTEWKEGRGEGVAVDEEVESRRRANETLASWKEDQLRVVYLQNKDRKSQVKAYNITAWNCFVYLCYLSIVLLCFVSKHATMVSENGGSNWKNIDGKSNSKARQYRNIAMRKRNWLSLILIHIHRPQVTSEAVNCI